MSDNDERNAIVTVLEWLLEDGQRWMERDESASGDAIKLLRSRFRPLRRHQLVNQIIHSRDGRGRFGEDYAIFIRPPKKERGAAAAVWCQWNLGGTLPKWGFYFGMWIMPPKSPDNEREEYGETIVFSGYRYETPDEQDSHDYYHVQACRSMGHAEIVQALPIPERNPTFPLAAKSAIELVLCLVVSLYGTDILAELETYINQDPPFRRQNFLRTSIDVFRRYRVGAEL